jgi:uncharacterized protein (DUF983 family)
MTYYLMDPPAEAGVETRCPGCGSGRTVWVSTGSQDNLLCKTCGTCWHKTEQHNDRVRVQECTGCRYRDLCLAAQG